MKVLVGIGHPAHVHFYKHSIFELQKNGHDVEVITKPREMATTLLTSYGIEHDVVGESSIQGHALLETIRSFMKYECDIFRKVKKSQPDVVTGIANVPLSHASSVFNCKSIIFTDTEHAKFQNMISFPFADRICTPDCYLDKISNKQIWYPSYHEFAYLHPDRYTPDTSICHQHGIDPDKQLVIIRLVSWQAVHDSGHSGFEKLETLIRELEKYGTQIVITAEGELSKELGTYQMQVPPHRIHDLLYHADLFLGESGTMAIESAVLGTPAVFVSSLDAGVLNELETKYGLLTRIYEGGQTETILNCSTELLQTDPSTWEQKRKKLLDDKIDTTSFVLDQIQECAEI